ncbi:MAG: hypothetical protein OXM55_06500 [Bdellovibrionales bacterium]|nr:hypothetical protein [Bdellovibrionales bacterium]
MKVKESDKNQIHFFKDNFTLKQYAAFTLIFNWILSKRDENQTTQYEILSKTHHFRKIYQYNNKSSYVFKELLNELRNYFSHYDSDWPQDKLNDFNKELEFLVCEAIAILEQKTGKKLDKDEKMESKIKKQLDNIKRNPNTFFLYPDKNIHLKLALIAAPFLTRSQMSFLSGKMFRGKELQKSSPEYLTQVKILETLSQNDRVLIPYNNKTTLQNGKWQENESFLSSKQEMGYAIWTRLEVVGLYNKENKRVSEGFPEDQWFIKQLVLYLEHTQALPSVRFARISTEKNEELKQLEQKTVFYSQSRENPLRIRHNTIEVEVDIGDNYRTNFGIHTLKYLVIAHFLDMDINDFVVKWLKNNQTRKGREQKNFGVTKERLKKHITSLIKKYSSWQKTEITLYEQIQFICGFINEAWNKKHEQYMNERQFTDFQQQVRHFRKDILREELKKEELLNISRLGFGKKNIGTLDSLIVTDRIQSVFTDMLTAHLEWLKEQGQKVSELSNKELESLACRLRLRNREQKNPKNNLKPVAMGFRVIKKEIERNKSSNPKRFFDHVRALSGDSSFVFPYFGLDKEDSNSRKAGWGDGNSRERCARVCLLLRIIPTLLEKNQLKISNEKPSAQIISKKIDNNISIKFTLTQGWRHYASIGKKRIKKLVDTYYRSNHKTVLPLLDNSISTGNQSLKANRKENVSPSISIQSLKKNSDRERFFLMQSILKWEKELIQSNKTKRPEEKSYTSFDEVLRISKIEQQAIREELKKFRRACMHNDIWKKPFSKVPEPLSSVYKQIEQGDKYKKHSQKSRARKKRLNKQKRNYEKAPIFDHFSGAKN